MPIPACLNVFARSGSLAKSAANVQLASTHFPRAITVCVRRQVRKWIMVSIWLVMPLVASVCANLSTPVLPVINVLMGFS